MAKSRFEYVRGFEAATDGGKLLPQTFAVVRLDGRGFHRFTALHGFRKPCDARALDLLNSATAAVMSDFSDVVMAYAQSDEVSFVLKRSCTLFGRRATKIVTTIVSLFSSAYTMRWSEFMREDDAGASAVRSAGSTAEDGDSKMNSSSEIHSSDGATASGKEGLPAGRVVPLQYPPSFDGRIVCYPTIEILRDYLSWRQADCHINNLYNTCFWALVQQGGRSEREAEARLKDTVSSQKNEILFSEFGINYNNEPAQFRKGSILIRATVAVPVTDSRNGEVKQRQVRQVQVVHDDLIADEFWQVHGDAFE